MSQIPQLSNGLALEHGISMFVDHGKGSGSKMSVGGQANADTSVGTAVTGTVTETELTEYAIPANALVAGSTIRMRAAVLTTAENGTDTLQTILRLGANTTASSNESVFANTAIDQEVNDITVWDVIVQVRSVGASGASIAFGTITNNDARPVAAGGSLKASFTLDTTVINYLSLTATWGSGSEDNSCRSEAFVVDIVNPST